MQKGTREIQSILSEITPDEVVFDSNIVKNELCPLLWSINQELRNDVYEKLLGLGLRFANFIGV